MQKKQTEKQWESSFSIYQEYDFAKIIAHHASLNIVNIKGLILLLKKMPVLGYMGGILGAPEIYGDFDKWWKAVNSINFSYLLIYTNKEISNLDQYRISPDDNYNMVVNIDLKEEDLLKGFQKRKQRTIKKSIKKDILIQTVKNESELISLYNIIKSTSQNGNLFYLPDYVLVKSIWNSKFGKAFIASYKNSIIGGFFFWLYKNTMFGWMGGVENEFKHLNISDVLHFHAMRWGYKNNFCYYDFGDQSLSKNPNLTGYKTKFNPMLIKSFTYKVPKSKYKILLSDKSRAIINMIKNKTDKTDRKDR